MTKNESINLPGAQPPRLRFGALRAEHECLVVRQMIGRFVCLGVGREARPTAPGTGAIPFHLQPSSFVRACFQNTECGRPGHSNANGSEDFHHFAAALFAMVAAPEDGRTPKAV